MNRIMRVKLMIVDLSDGELLPLINAGFILRATFQTPWMDSMKFQQGEIVGYEFLHGKSNLVGLDLPEVVGKETMDDESYVPVESSCTPVVFGREELMPRWRDSPPMLVAQINPLLLRRIASEFPSPAGISFQYTPGVADTQLQHLMIALRAEIEEGCPGGRSFGESVTHSLAIHLVRKYSVAADQPGARQHGLPLRRLREVNAYIEAHLTEVISVHQLAKIAHISVYHFGVFSRKVPVCLHTNSSANAGSPGPSSCF